MKNLLVKSYAKINIVLNVLGKQEDGYHQLDMVMLPLQLHDSILLSSIKGAPDNYVTIDDFSLGDIQYNLATFAIDSLQKKYGFDNKFRVFIHKVLPIQAGLGGGSSNAAATMLGVNKYLKLGMTEQDFIDVGKKLGADVPFFTKNIPARCQGIGEIITPITVKNDYYVILVKPKEGCSTREIYGMADEMQIQTYDVETVIKALEEGDDELLAKSIGNSLEPAGIKKVPEVQIIKNKLKERGLSIVMMSGSGSVVFGMSTNKKLIKKIGLELEDEYRVEITKVLK
ncbi:MAG: 4-(cytidine 5'-diphospho)-2-C-methyl-D-erythritol kinase [Bacilli bacterium]|nr:4-(cytidine 5'-diphospho)-2-C-methyl-D-erythritol kinase [Bacilli bacterium]